MYQLSVVIPSGKIFEDTVESVAAPGLEGGLEVFSKHMSILCALTKGSVRIRKDGKDIKSFMIDSGVLEVDANHNVLILADQILDDIQK